MNKILIAVIAILVLGAGVFVLSNKTNGPAAVNVASTPVATSQETATASPSAKVEEASVTVTANGFAPQTLKIKTGTKVTWTNKSGATANVSSDNHPTHLLYPFLNLGSFDDGSSVNVTFDKAGTFTYHNHLNPSQKGTVVVE